MMMMTMMMTKTVRKEVLPRDPLCPHSTSRPSWEYEMNSEIESYDDDDDDVADDDYDDDDLYGEDDNGEASSGGQELGVEKFV